MTAERADTGWPRARVDEVDQALTTATATIEGSSKEIPLVKTDDGWRIGRLDFSDAPKR
jgi:hypothetical protein